VTGSGQTVLTHTEGTDSAWSALSASCAVYLNIISMSLDEGLHNLCLMRCQLRRWCGALAPSLTQHLLEVCRQPHKETEVRHRTGLAAHLSANDWHEQVCIYHTSTWQFAWEHVCCSCTKKQVLCASALYMNVEKLFGPNM